MPKQPTKIEKKVKVMKPIKGYAVVLNRNLSSIYYPKIWQNCYTIFPTIKSAKLFMGHGTYNEEGKIIPVEITYKASLPKRKKV